MRRGCLLPLVLAASIALIACGGDDATPAPAPSPTVTETAVPATPAAVGPTATPDRRTPTPAPTSPPDLTSRQVCDLVPAASVARALGVADATAEAGDFGTPQCSYAFASGNSTNNVVLAVMRAEDVGGLTGAAAFEFAVSINRALGGDAARETEVSSLGDQAVFIEGPIVSILIVQAGLRVVTVAGTELTAESSAAIALGAVEY